MNPACGFHRPAGEVAWAESEGCGIDRTAVTGTGTSAGGAEGAEGGGTGRALLLYDGVCGLCNRLVRFILERDRKDRFRFASLQGPVARDALARHGKDPADLDTVHLLLEHGTPLERALSRGRAVRAALRLLGGGWGLLGRLLHLVPPPLLDAAYRCLARRRYRIFGKLESCPIPEPRHRAKFM